MTTQHILTKKEMQLISKILGGLTDLEFNKVGITGNDREKVRDLYYQLIPIVERDDTL